MHFYMICIRRRAFIISVHHKVSGSYILQTVWPRIIKFYTDIHTEPSYSKATPDITSLTTSCQKLLQKNFRKRCLDALGRPSRERFKCGSHIFLSLEKRTKMRHCWRWSQGAFETNWNQPLLEISEKSDVVGNCWRVRCREYNQCKFSKNTVKLRTDIWKADDSQCQLESAVGLDLRSKDQVSKLSEWDEDNEEHERKTGEVFGTRRYRDRQLVHWTTETDELEHLEKERERERKKHLQLLVDSTHIQPTPSCESLQSVPGRVDQLQPGVTRHSIKQCITTTWNESLNRIHRSVRYNLNFPGKKILQADALYLTVASQVKRIPFDVLHPPNFRSMPYGITGNSSLLIQPDICT